MASLSPPKIVGFGIEQGLVDTLLLTKHHRRNLSVWRNSCCTNFSNLVSILTLFFPHQTLHLRKQAQSNISIEYYLSQKVSVVSYSRMTCVRYIWFKSLLSSVNIVSCFKFRIWCSLPNRRAIHSLLDKKFCTSLLKLNLDSISLRALTYEASRTCLVVGRVISWVSPRS